MSRKKKKKSGFWKNAFAIEKSEDFQADEKDVEIMDAFAEFIVKRGMAIPSILFLESARPMNFIGASTMAFFEPVVRGIFPTWEGYTRFYKMMEHRGSVSALIHRIELMEQKRQETIKENRAKSKSKKSGGENGDQPEDKP